MAEKKLLINQVKIANIQDRSTIPTRIQYQGKSFEIGHDVVQGDTTRGRVIGNFKIELGRQTREQSITKKSTVSKGYSRTVTGVAKDFLSSLCDRIAADIEKYGQPLPKKVLVAEPISIEEEGKYLGNGCRTIDMR